MKPMKFFLFATLLFSGLFITSCQKDKDVVTDDTTGAANYDDQVIVDWYSLIKTLTMETPGYTPPVAARAFGYTGVALYESIVPGISDRKSLSGVLNDLEITSTIEAGAEYHWPTVANTTLATMTKYFYENASSDKMTEIIALETNYASEFSTAVDADIYNRSVAFAQAISAEILEWAKTDGGYEAQYNNFPTDFQPPVGEQYWTPAPPLYQSALQPYWGSNRPFMTANVTNTQPEAPPAFSSDATSLCFQRAMEVYNTVNSLSAEEKIIAEFWADDPTTTATPPGHSISILNQLLAENNTNLAFAAEAYVKLSIAISDAFISCWKTKYAHAYPRPITYINNYIDANWSPVLSTPPFPEYTSGHSVQSGAMAEVLTKMFGEDYNFIDHTHEGRNDIDGTPRSFNSFYEMAEEAALSRLYGGIHYHESIFNGLDQGYKIGQNINNLDLKAQ